jgi:hypothetical protein
MIHVCLLGRDRHCHCLWYSYYSILWEIVTLDIAHVVRKSHWEPLPDYGNVAAFRGLHMRDRIF